MSGTTRQQTNKVITANIALKKSIERLYDKEIAASNIKSELNAATKLASFNKSISEIQGENKDSSGKPVSKNYLDEIGKMMIGVGNDAILADLEPRRKLYQTYRFIIANFPQVANSLKIIVDHILNPEQLNEKQLIVKNAKLDNSISVENTTSETNELNDIIKRFKLDERAREIVTSTIRDGDCFIEIIDSSAFEFGDKDTLLKESKEKNLKEINQYDAIKEESIEKLGEEFSKSLNSNATDLKNIKEISEGLAQQFQVNSFDFETEILIENMNFHSKNNELDKGEKVSKQPFDNLIVKLHNPDTVVKLEIDSIEFGYLVVSPEAELSQEENLFQKYAVASSKDTKGQVKDFDLTFKKYLIPKIIGEIKPDVSNKKIIAKLVNNSKQLKQLLFHIFINNQKANIRFVKADYMQHFKNPGLNSTDKYGEGLLASHLFMIKHYFAVLMSHTVFSLTRAVEKELVTVNVNVDGDVESSLTEVIKRMRQKEDIVNKDLSSIDNFSVETSMFDRYYIPKINGEQPINIENIPSGQSTLDPMHLENLRQNIIRGIRVPKNLIGETDGTYKTSFTQENFAFAMSTIGYQRNFSSDFTELASKIRRIDSGKEFSKTLIGFQTPDSLLTEKMDMKVNSVQNAVEFIYNVYVDLSTGTPDVKMNKSEIAKELFPEYDWEKFDDIFENSKKTDALSKIIKPKDNTTDGGMF